MKPYLLVGDLPDRDHVGRPDRWLLPDRSGKRRAANRFLALSGLSTPEFDDLFDRTVVWPMVPWAGRGMAKQSVEQRSELFQGRALVVIGGRASYPFGDLYKTDWFTWRFNVPFASHAVRVPSPHPENRLLNDPAMRERFRTFFRGLRERWESTGVTTLPPVST